MINLSAKNADLWWEAAQIFPELWRFLKSPFVCETKVIWTPLIRRQLSLLFLLDLLLIGPLLMYMDAYESILISTGWEPPLHQGFDDNYGLWSMLLVGGVIGPVMEEMQFRGWLKGTPRQLYLLVFLMASLVALFAFFYLTENMHGALRMFLLVALLATIVGIVLEIFFRTKADAEPIPFFSRHFRVIFWTSAILFGLVHVTNYEGGTYLMAVPMVLPQLIIAPVWAFARLRFGLGAAILLHGVSNSVLILMDEAVLWLGY